ncbi:sensor histidine kinase [Nonomuraea sp. NPDC050556]|uniref:sensor histidine kinase n=1 Tax=Nonomuraea sp. NPDC050556 TaxID=3364369 RepID=UPI0037B86CF6
MRGRFWTSIYLVFLGWPIPVYLEEGGNPVPVLLGVAVFAALYLRVVWTAMCRLRGNATPWSLALLIVTAALLVPPLGQLWMFVSLFFVVTALGCSLPRRWLPFAVVAVVAAVVLSLGSDLAAFWWIPAQGLLFTGAIDAFVRAGEANTALAIERARAERLAVDNERLRFSRDMHDILGHSLSVMTLKSQLAGRLVESDPPRARAEIGEVEELSRQALAEVREAVSGYRTLSMPDELDNARRVLAAAGVGLEVSSAPIPADAESLLAWVVREGTTNVVRHSRAVRCEIRLGVEDSEAYVEVADDGRGPGAQEPGTGLLGLSERLQAMGGTLRSDRAPAGGYLLSARLPV